MEEKNIDAKVNANDDSVENSPSDKQNANASTQDTGAQSNAPDKKTDEIINYEFKGDWQELQEKAPQAYEWAKGVRQYLTRETNKISKDQDKIDKYTKLESDPELQEFMDWKKARKTGQIPANQQAASYSQQDLDSGYDDPAVVKMRNELAEKERLITQHLSQIDQRVSRLDAANALEAFAQAHPDFYELDRLGLIGPQLQKIEQRGKGTIADAYSAAVEEKERIIDRIKREEKASVSKKKNASSATPTSAGEPDTEFIEARGHDDIIKRAFELARKGQTKSVRRKK